MIINAQKDNKDFYAYDKCVKAMYKNQAYGLSKYGDKDDLPTINNKNLYEQYKQMIDTCKIDIIVSSDFSAEEVEKIINDNKLIQAIKPREEKIKINDIKKEIKDIIENPEEYKGKWNKLFNNDNNIEIEIGTGKGKFIIEKALQNSNINFIGIEKYDSPLVSAVKKLEELDINNLRLICYDAFTIDNIFDKEISKIYLNFS